MPVNHGTSQDYELTLDKFITHAAKWHPDKFVVTAAHGTPDARITYRELCARARRLSSVLQEAGVEAGECVATLAWNTQAHMEAWFAIMGIGAVCHTLNPRLGADVLADMLRQSRARVLIASGDQRELLRAIAEHGCDLERVFLIDESDDASLPEAPGLRVERFVADADHGDAEWGGFDERSPSGLCFTSGTTGAPKGVTYTHRGVFLHTLRQLQAGVAGIVEDDVVLPAVPMFHANGWGLPFACAAVGATLVLPGRDTDGASLAGLISRHAVTIAVGVPTVWLDLVDHLDRTGMSLPSLRRVMVGGAPMPEALHRRMSARGIDVQQTWGMTELSPLGTAMCPGTGTHPTTSSGTVALGVDLQVTDHLGRALDRQRENEGRLHVRGPAVVERYFGEDRPATADGWFDTGDLAVIDRSGNVRITGRSKDLIKSGGEWINPVEIEAVVGAVPGIAKVAVIPRHHDKWGERPVMVIELANGAALSDEALMEPLRERFPKWWMPDAIIRVPSIPLATTGKLDKKRLQSEFGGA